MMVSFASDTQRSALPGHRITDDPGDGSDDRIKRLHFAAFMAAPLGRGWAPRMVRAELRTAFHVLGASVGSVRPKREGSGMPYQAYDDLEVWLDRNVPGWRAGGNREYERFSADKITAMESVIRWQLTYLADYPTELQPHPGIVLAVWLRTHHRRGLALRAYKKHGWGETLAKRRVEQALRIIAMGLMRDGVLPPAHYYQEEEPVIPSWSEALAPSLPKPAAPVDESVGLPLWWEEIAAIEDRARRNSALWYALEADMPQAPGAGALRMARFYNFKRLLEVHPVFEAEGRQS